MLKLFSTAATWPALTTFFTTFSVAVLVTWAACSCFTSRFTLFFRELAIGIGVVRSHECFFGRLLLIFTELAVTIGVVLSHECCFAFSFGSFSNFAPSDNSSPKGVMVGGFVGYALQSNQKVET